jgi:hypothetical protein
MVLMWSTLSALFMAALWGMQSWLDSRAMAFTLGQWAVYVSWLLWTLFGIAFVRTMVAEGEPRAVKVGSLIFGGTSAAVGGTLAWLWIFAQ